MLFRSTCSFLAPRKILGHMKDQLAGITKNLDVVQGCVTLISSSLKKKTWKIHFQLAPIILSKKLQYLTDLFIPSLNVDIYIYTCGLPASAVAIISGWGRFGNVGYRSSPGPPGGRRTHKVVIHQQRRRRNTAFLKLFLINIWETNPAVDTRSARSLKKFQFCGCKVAPLPKISLPRICPTSQGE